MHGGVSTTLVLRWPHGGGFPKEEVPFRGPYNEDSIFVGLLFMETTKLLPIVGACYTLIYTTTMLNCYSGFYTTVPI